VLVLELEHVLQLGAQTRQVKAVLSKTYPGKQPLQVPDEQSLHPAGQSLI